MQKVLEGIIEEWSLTLMWDSDIERGKWVICLSQPM